MASFADLGAVLGINMKAVQRVDAEPVVGQRERHPTRFAGRSLKELDDLLENVRSEIAKIRDSLHQMEYHGTHGIDKAGIVRLTLAVLHTQVVRLPDRHCDIKIGTRRGTWSVSEGGQPPLRRSLHSGCSPCCYSCVGGAMCG